MWILYVILSIIVIALFLTLKSVDKTSEVKQPIEKQKKTYAMPKQRRYPWFYIKECHFYADGSSRFGYSEEEIEQLNLKLEENMQKQDYTKAIKVANEVIRAVPKFEKVWTNKITAIFQDVIIQERPWEESYSKVIINSCYGFFQVYDGVIERSLATKHILLPLLLKSCDELIKYQSKNFSKVFNFEVYNLLVNLYYVMPFREFINLVSNNLLEDKFDKSIEKNEYATQTIKSFLNHIEMIRNRSTSRLQETFDSRKVTNCTLTNDNEASVVMFDLSFDIGQTTQKIEALFYDGKGEEINFGKNPKENERYVDVFQANSQRGATEKEEIVLLTERFVDTVRVRLYTEKKPQEIFSNVPTGGKPVETAKEVEQPRSKDIQSEKMELRSEEAILADTARMINKDKTETKNTNSSSDETIKEEKKPEKETEEETKEGEVESENEISKEETLEEKAEEVFPKKEVPQKPQTLVYPSFDDITQIKMSDNRLVCLKNNGTVIMTGEDNLEAATVSWTEVEKVFLTDKMIFGVKKDGTVSVAGELKYDKSEYIYSWENVDQIIPGVEHVLGLSKNNTVMATGKNDNQQCDIDEWYDIIQICINRHSVGLMKDGTVKAIGENNFGECDVGSWKDIVQIAVGDFYTVGLTSLGTVVATGLNSCGQCNVAEWANIKKIYAAGNMTVGLRYDGRVVTAGKNSYRFEDIRTWNRIKEIVMSNNRIIGIEQDGSIFATGKPYKDFVPNDWQNIKQIVINSNNVVGLKEDGTLISNGLVFGEHVSNELNNVIEFKEDLQANKIATLNDQNIVTLINKKQQNDTTEMYPALYDIKKIDISGTHLVALKNDGNVSYINFEEKMSADVPDWNSIVDIAAGDGFFAGLAINGKVVAKGDNQYGQCEVSSWVDIVRIEAAGNRMIGQTVDGKLLVAGINDFGEKDFLSLMTNVKDFAMTRQQAMILEKDGTLKVTYHPVGINAEAIKDWKNIKKVVARGNNFLALTEDGTVYSTMENEVEITKWHDVEDINASGNCIWATLKMQ